MASARDKLREVELAFFQNDVEKGAGLALELAGTLDMDDDDDAAVMASMLSRCLVPEAAARFLEGLKAKGFDPSTRFPDGNTIATLYASSGRCDADVFQSIVGFGADPYAADRTGMNAMHHYARLERSPWTKERDAQVAGLVELMGEASNWMTADAYGATPLHHAALNRNPQLVQAFLAAGADPDVRGADIRQGFGHSVAFDGTAALHIACLLGDDASVRALIDAGADASAKDIRGRVPAHYAVSPPPQSLCREYESIPGREAVNGRKDAILRMLGEVDVPDDKGVTPLLLSVTAHRYDSASFAGTLLELGASPDTADNGGTTPLMGAAINANMESVKALVSAGASLDLRDSGGRTALHHAIAWRFEKIARYLVKKGASTDIPDNGGVTAGEMAASAGMESVLEAMMG